MTSNRLDKTRSGLKYMILGFYGYAIVGFITGAILYIWSFEPSTDPTLLICFPALIALAGMILILLGIVKIYSASSDIISSSHDLKMKLAVMILIIGYILGQISSNIDLPRGSLHELQNAFITRSVLSLFRNAAYGIMPVILVDELAEKGEKNFLYLGTFILLGSSLFYMLFCMFPLSSIGSIDDMALQALRMKSISLIMTSIGFLFFALSFRKIRGVKKQTSFSFKDYGTPKEDRNTCPECGSETKIYPDGSVHCENCGYATESPFRDDP